MLRIEVNSYVLDLLENAELEMNAESPFLDYKKMQGTYGFTLNVPGTTTNKKAFNFPDHLDTQDFKYFTLQPIKVYVEDIFLFNGVAKITGVRGNLHSSNASYTLAIGTELGNLGDGLLNRSLRTFDLGTITSGTGSSYQSYWETLRNSMNLQDSSTSNYCAYPVYNHTVPSAVGSFTNLPHFTSEGNYPITDHNFHPYLIFVIKSVFSQLGYNLKIESILADRDFLQLTIVIVNYFYSNPAWVAGYMPNAKVSELLNSLRSLFNAGIFIQKSSKQVRVVTYNDICNSSKIIDITSKVLTEFEYEPNTFDGFSFKQTIDPHDIVSHPDDVDYTQHTTIGEANKFTSLPAANGNPLNNRIVHNEVAIYTEELPTRKLLQRNYTAYKSGNAKLEVESPASASAMIMYDVSLHPYVSPPQGWTPPRFLLPHLVPATAYGHSALRYAFYRGLQPASNGQNYALGTSGMHNWDGNPCGTWHLGWAGANGLYEKFWKLMFTHRSRWPYKIKFKVNLNYNDIIELDLAARYRIGTAEYIIASINYKLPLKEACDIKFFRIK